MWNNNIWRRVHIILRYGLLWFIEATRLYFRELVDIRNRWPSAPVARSEFNQEVWARPDQRGPA